jgi:hypothetical protein
MKNYLINTKTKSKKIFIGFVVALMLGTVALPLLNPGRDSLEALSGSDFKAGRIIDDAIFFNDSTMTISQIQQFLNSKVPVCDTNGQVMYNSTQTRAQWAQANGRPLPPYICLKDFSQNVPSVTNSGSNLCTGNISGGSKSAARIIYEVGKACGINPQVLLVMLQKEMSLITDTWPWPRQYEIAMGYGCPDSGPNYSANCSSTYYGFFNQVYQAAQAYRRYEANPTWYNYRPDRNNYIQYHPNPACGGTNVFIENQATANLYIYTPYQPNSAALNNLYGTGNSCSAYGNRNFWRLFNDWFGSTFAGTIYFGGIKFETNKELYTDRKTVISFRFRNASRETIDVGRLKIEAISPSGVQVNFPSESNIKVGPWDYYEYKQAGTFDEEGVWSIYISRNYNGQWIRPIFNDFNYDYDPRLELKFQKRPTITQSLRLTASSNEFRARNDITATFDVKNHSSLPIDIGRLKAQAHHSNGTQYDFESTVNNLTLQPGETYTYSSTRTLPRTGSYTIFINNIKDGKWSQSYPENENGSIVRKRTFKLREPATITQSLRLTASSNEFRARNDITATFDVKNHSSLPIDIGRLKAQAHHSNGTQYDFESTVNNLTLQPGETYTYSSTRTLPRTGSYTIFINNIKDGKWSQSYPENENGSIVRKRTFKLREPATITQSLRLTANSNEFRARNDITATFDVKNHSSLPIDIGRLKAQAHHSNGTQYDFESTVNNLTLQPGETYTYSSTRTLPRTGSYTIFINNIKDGKWSQSYPENENGSIVRKRTFKLL